jgi:hypothetical protein
MAAESTGARDSRAGRPGRTDRPRPPRPGAFIGHRPAEPGLAVAVRSRFENTWSQGFEVAEVHTTDGHVEFQVRRLSDGFVLPVLFGEDEVTPADS